MQKTGSVSEQIRANPGLIPTLPDVVAKAMKLLEDPEAGPADFDKLLSRDPGLVAHMLRFANSPIHGFAHKRETVRDAIIGMGLRGLRGILFGSTLKRFSGPQFGCYGGEKVLWRHAMAVAMGAKLLTQHLPASPDDAEEMFVAGLLHDLGKLLLAPFLTHLGKNPNQGMQPVHVQEERLLGIDHQEAGGFVAEKWNLRPMIRSVIQHHHYDTCPQAHRHAVAVVRLADQCSTNAGNGAGKLDPDTRFLATDLAVVGWEPQQWAEVSAAVVESVQLALAES